MKKRTQGIVREIMTVLPVTLRHAATLELAHSLISFGRIGHLPIMNDGKLVGLVNRRDLLSSVSKRIPKLSRRSRSALFKDDLAKHVMKKRVVTVAPNTPIKKAARLMAEKKAAAYRCFRMEFWSVWSQPPTCCVISPCAGRTQALTIGFTARAQSIPDRRSAAQPFP